METGDQIQVGRDDAGRKDLRLITEVAITTMSSRGVRVAFEEFRDKPTMGLLYTLSYCTFPLLEDVMRVIIEVGTDPPDQLPDGLYSARSYNLQWLWRHLRAPTVFEPGEAHKFIGRVDKNVRTNRPSHVSLARLQRERRLIAGYSVFENVITAASEIWPGSKYLEADVRMSEHADLIPLAFDLSRWLLIPDPPKKSARGAAVGCSAVAGTMVLSESRHSHREHPFDASSEQP